MHVQVTGMLRRVRLSATPRTVARHAPLSMGFSRQEYWSGDLPSPGIQLTSLASPALAGRFFTTQPPEKPSKHHFPFFKPLCRNQVISVFHSCASTSTIVYSSYLPCSGPEAEKNCKKKTKQKTKKKLY